MKLRRFPLSKKVLKLSYCPGLGVLTVNIVSMGNSNCVSFSVVRETLLFLRYFLLVFRECLLKPKADFEGERGYFLSNKLTVRIGCLPVELSDNS